jgi:DNA-binding LytR/AlgR family response regulator
MRCIIIDDEPLALDLLEDNIRQVPFLELVARCSNPVEAMKVLQQQPVGLMFLDIQMPGLTGLQFIKSMAEKPLIILITAYEKYALEGFNLDVVDYLVKPVALDRFIKACNKAHELFQLRARDKEQGAPAGAHPEYFFVNVDYSLLKVDTEDIVWVEGLRDYIRIHLQSSARPIITRMSMKSIEEQLPQGRFIRTHKSYLVAIRYITSIRKSSIFIAGKELPVGELYRDAVSALTGRQ